MCVVQLTDRTGAMDMMMMMGLDETIDQLAVAGHVLRRWDGHVLRRAFISRSNMKVRKVVGKEHGGSRLIKKA